MDDDPCTLAWLAGFWDGEGCVGNHVKYATPYFSLGQAGGEGRELCERVRAAAGLNKGCVNGPYLGGVRRSGYYMVRITGGKAVKEMLEKCRPWLSRTKIEQAENALARWHAYRIEFNVRDRAAQTHCKYGHIYDEKNTARTPKGFRICRRCRADGEARRRAVRKTLPPNVPLAS
jgi:hypothetical protein